MDKLRKYINTAQAVVIVVSAVISTIAGALGAISPLEAGAIAGVASGITAVASPVGEV